MIQTTHSVGGLTTFVPTTGASLAAREARALPITRQFWEKIIESFSLSFSSARCNVTGSCRGGEPMKTRIKNLLLVPLLIAGFGLIPAGRVTAQTFTNLHSFIGSTDGESPPASLILSGNTLYGTAELGGSSGAGTVFAVTTDGTGFTNLHSFTTAPYPSTINSDGANPYAGLILSGNTLYGTASQGGSSGVGTVFAINTDGTDYSTLYSLIAPFDFDSPESTNSDGAYPDVTLVLSGNTLYGAAYWGGAHGNGTVFKVNTNGTGFTTLHSFSAGSGSFPFNYTNSDGVGPDA